MAISTFNQGTPLANTLVYQSDGTSTGDDGILTSGSTVYSIVVDNSANSGTGGDAYTKLYNGTAASSNDPFMVLFTYRATKRTYVFPEGIYFSAALGLRCVTGAATSNTTSPSSDVKIYIVGNKP